MSLKSDQLEISLSVSIQPWYFDPLYISGKLGSDKYSSWML